MSHIVGKVYDVTAETINALVRELDAAQEREAALVEALDQILNLKHEDLQFADGLALIALESNRRARANE